MYGVGGDKPLLLFRRPILGSRPILCSFGRFGYMIECV